MNLIKYIFLNIIETLLRVFPFPCKTGLIKISEPDRNSYVFLTCNYHLTVARVKRALKGQSCYLLVANSRGHNVWCGAAGGHLTNHSAVSVLKTSGIEDHVDHRNIILPQLSAAGIESKVIREKTGWNVIWGPVYAKDIPAFIENNLKKTRGMHEVIFSLFQRIEMAVAWAFPFSLISFIVLLPLWRDMVLPVCIFIWIVSLVLFLLFPLYGERLSKNRLSVGPGRFTVFFDFSRIAVILWTLFLSGLAVYGISTGMFTWEFILRWSFISVVIVLVFSMDLPGSTPVYKSGLHEDRLLKVFLDEEKCKGAGFCRKVCPRNCYYTDKNRHITAMMKTCRCVQCGACIVQCPFNALYFKSPKGEIITPEAIRKFKLNLLGKRLVKAEKEYKI